MKSFILILVFEMSHFTLSLAIEEKCSGEICIPLDYDKHHLPNTNETNEVMIDISELRILKIDDNDCIIKSSFWMHTHWNEPRLIVSPNATKDFHKLDELFYEYLWIPDIVIPSVDDIDMIHFFNNKRDLIYIPNTKILMFSVNVVLETYCSMKFENYPMDIHTCGIYFKSWSNNASFVRLSSRILEFEKDFNILEYSLDVHKVPVGSEITQGMIFSYTGFKIKLKRNINKYIANYYVPSGILVTITWVNKIIINCNYIYNYIID